MEGIKEEKARYTKMSTAAFSTQAQQGHSLDLG